MWRGSALMKVFLDGNSSISHGSLQDLAVSAPLSHRRNDVPSQSFPFSGLPFRRLDPSILPSSSRASSHMAFRASGLQQP